MNRLITIVLLTASGVGQALAQVRSPEQTAAKIYKNIQVFEGLPASQLQTVMTFMAGSLGVQCSHCHAGPFDKDDKLEKQTARRMIRMVFDINKGDFDGINAVTCYTCHRGQPTPLTVPPVGPNAWQRDATADAKSETALPPVNEVLAKYVVAIGGKAALMKLRTRIVKGSRVGADGVLVPEEVFQKAPNKLLIVTRYSENLIRKGFDGTNWWATDSKGQSLISVQDGAEVERDADFYKDLELGRLYSQMRVTAREKIGDRHSFVIAARSLTGDAERLYFDQQTGLLTRRYREFQTALGSFPSQTDYEDYKEVDGVKVPFTIRWSIPGRTWGRKIAEVKHNIRIDDADFSQRRPEQRQVPDGE